MIRKLLVALSAAVFTIGVVITVLGHCGSTWVVAPPTFGPTLTRSDCTTGGASTRTSKSVATTIHWTVGPALPIVVTDFGENKITTTSVIFGDGCKRCFPTFNAPEWIDLGNGVTEWSQKTWAVLVSGNNECFQENSTPLDNHYGRNCTVDEEVCENEFSWFWNPFSDSCQEEGPPECNLFPEVCENGQWSFEWCGCVGYNTPIVLDLNGNGFDLTNVDHGVPFNLNKIGGKEKLAWTSASSDEAWLVLDRNGNETIDDGAELFGDITEQPEPPAGEKKNGFRALAEYDRVSNGGNANGQIESEDSVFRSLRLWQDANHDGLSEPSELHTLPTENVAAIELDYKSSKKSDSHGNQFGFRAKVKNSQGHQLGRWAWDVYLLRAP